MMTASCIFDQPFEFTELKQQQLIRVEPFSILALQRLQQFFDCPFALFEPLLLRADSGREFNRLLLRDDDFTLGMIDFAVQ